MVGTRTKPFFTRKTPSSGNNPGERNTVTREDIANAVALIEKLRDGIEADAEAYLDEIVEALDDGSPEALTQALQVQIDRCQIRQLQIQIIRALLKGDCGNPNCPIHGKPHLKDLN